MDLEQIITGNRLIAEFLGKPKCNRCQEDCGKYTYGVVFFGPEEMEYHKDWGWLMPVAEKIFTYKDAYGQTAHFRDFGRQNPVTGNYIVRIRRNVFCESPSLLTATWSACIDFIQWYNTQPRIKV